MYNIYEKRRNVVYIYIFKIENTTTLSGYPDRVGNERRVPFAVVRNAKIGEYQRERNEKKNRRKT